MQQVDRGDHPLLSQSQAERMKKCRFCGEEIQLSAQKCKHCREFLTPAARRAAGLQPVQRQQNIGKVDIPYGPAILSFLCFLPLGIISLVFAIQADNKLKVGDTAGAAAQARVARAVGIVGMLIGLVELLLWVGWVTSF